MAKRIKQHKYLHSIKKDSLFWKCLIFRGYISNYFTIFYLYVKAKPCCTMMLYSARFQHQGQGRTWAHSQEMILEQDTTENSQVLFSSGFKRCPVSSQVSTTYTLKKKQFSLPYMFTINTISMTTPQPKMFFPRIYFYVQWFQTTAASKLTSQAFNLQTTIKPQQPQWLLSASAFTLNT